MLFGLAAFVSGQDGFELTDLESKSLAAALFSLAGAALIGIAIQSPRRYRESEVAWMKDLTGDHYWNASASDGEITVADSRLSIIEIARDANDDKAEWLMWGVAAEAAGVFFIALTVISILL